MTAHLGARTQAAQVAGLASAGGPHWGGVLSLRWFYLDKAVRYRKAAPDPRRSSVSVHVIHAIMHAKLDPPGH